MVLEATDGDVTIEVFPAQQLGTAREMIEATQMGSIQAVFTPTANFVGFEATMAIPGLPFLFPSRDMAYDLLVHGEIGSEILAGLEDEGLKGVGIWESGFKQLTSNKPIRTME